MMKYRGSSKIILKTNSGLSIHWKAPTENREKNWLKYGISAAQIMNAHVNRIKTQKNKTFLSQFGYLLKMNMTEMMKNGRIRI